MISQKTVGRLDTLLRRLFRRSDQVATLWTWKQLRDVLYESGPLFDVHLLDCIEQRYGGDPRTFLPLIHNGTIPAFVYRHDGWGAPAPNDQDRISGQVLLIGMIEAVTPIAQSIPRYVSPPLPTELCADVIASLREDGLDFIGGKIVDAKIKAVDLKKEDEYLIALIRSMQPANMADIEHHHDESEKAFANGQWGSVSSEARNFLMAVLRGLREVATTRGKVPAFKQPGKDGPLIDDFKTIGLFTEDEKNAIMHVWVLLGHSGPHVGIKEQDSARLSRLLAIGMAEWIALKFVAWDRNGFHAVLSASIFRREQRCSTMR